jgi:glutamate dehydrogenase (NAD(P)+)
LGKTGLDSRKESDCRSFRVTAGDRILGYVAIDSTIGGRSCGGLRMLPALDEAEMRSLGHAMTLKYGFLGLPQGGAKAGVIGDPEAPEPERMKCLVEFGRAIEPLLRTHAYIPNSDMGTSNADIRYMLNAVGISAGRRELRSDRSGYYTACSVLAGVVQATRHVGLNLSQCTVAVEGFGSVGRPLAMLLDKAGGKIVAISNSLGGLYNPRGLEVDRLIQLAKEVGSRVVEVYPEAESISRETLLELPVDIICPCAHANSLNVDKVPRIAARVICAGANDPITPSAEYALSERGVVCLPDFVTNCGGVLGGTMEFASVSRAQIEAFIDEQIGARIAWLLGKAEAQRRTPRQVMVPLALHRFEEVAQSASDMTPLRRLFQMQLNLYRRGLIPGFFVAPLSIRYFSRTMVSPADLSTC